MDAGVEIGMEAGAETDPNPDPAATLVAMDQLLLRAQNTAIHFGVGEPQDDDALEIRALLDEAELPEGSARPRWAEAEAELFDFLRRIQEDLSKLAVVHTGSGGEPLVGTWHGWSGDTVTIVADGAPPSILRVHSAALVAEAGERLWRLQMLSTVVAGAVRIAGLVSTGAGVLLALPIALRLIRTLRERAEKRPTANLQLEIE